MTIRELCALAFKEAQEKGWYEPPKSKGEVIALIHSEVSEALEEIRKGRPALYHNDGSLKPEGELVELADVVIRIADYCGSNGWDLEWAIVQKMRYNSTRTYRHGGKIL